MADRVERLTARRKAVLAAMIVAALVASLLVLTRRHHTATADGAEQSLVVEPRPFTATLSVVGTVAPGDSTSILAPFDGMVTKVAFDYGRPVAAGQVLFVMDPADLDQHRREAETTFLKADQAERDMADWTNGPDVARAKRAVTTAELELKATASKATETKALLDKGLVARTEYDGLVQQQQSQALALTAAQEDLATVLKRGEGDGRRATAIELETAHASLASLDAQRADATVLSPAAGMIVRPPVEKSDPGGGAIHAGQKLNRGQLVAQIARAGGLDVAMALGEEDASKVREGQPVTVTGPGFGGVTVNGLIKSVAGEATQGEPGGGATFAVIARLDSLSPEQVSAIRIGMSANVVITTYQARSALVVPPQAILGGPPAALVTLRNLQTGKTRRQPVMIGAAAPDGVEIKSGLKAGDIVVWRTPDPLHPN